MKIKSISKSFVSLIVAVALLLGAGILALMNLTSKPTNRVSAAAQTIEGSSVTWEYNNSTHTLTLGGSGDMPGQFGLGDGIYPCPWESVKNDIWFVSIGDNVTSITVSAFRECFNLIEVSFTSVNEIGSDAFRLCTSLKRVNCSEDGYCVIPSNVYFIDYYAFADCTLINNVVVLGGDTTIIYNDGLESGPFFADSDEEGFFDTEILSECKIYVVDSDDYAGYYNERNGEKYGNGWVEYFNRDLVQSGVPTGFVLPGSGDSEQTGISADIILPSIFAVTLGAVTVMYLLTFKKRKRI